MSFRWSNLIALGAALPLAAQQAGPSYKFSGLIQAWYAQALDSDLRRNSNALPTGNGARSYYNLRSDFRENGFTLRRVEIKVSGTILSGLDFEVMIDPSINTSATNPTILQDAFIQYKNPNGFEIKAGQFKPLQTYEAFNVGAGDIIFAERGQFARFYGDRRDRGVVAAYRWGQSDRGFNGKAYVGVFNGLSDSVAGKSNDTNAQKDWVARLELNAGAHHRFGLYTLQGSTDLADGGTLRARTLTVPGAPTAAEILNNKDQTTNYGAFYVFENKRWHGSVELITGLVGRRFPTLASTTPVAFGREHLDQKFQTYVLTGVYTHGRHSYSVRHDRLDFNSGDDYYGPYNPYTQNVSTGASLGADYSPEYTETTFGYRFAFLPERLKAANLKVNYVLRSKNFLAPRAGQTGEQGGDTLVAAFQVAW